MLTKVFNIENTSKLLKTKASLLFIDSISLKSISIVYSPELSSKIAYCEIFYFTNKVNSIH